MSEANMKKIEDDLITAELSRASHLSVENKALRDERDRLAELVRQAQPHVCSLLCPSVKARHELWTHTKLCLNMQAALTPAGGGSNG